MNAHALKAANARGHDLHHLASLPDLAVLAIGYHPDGSSGMPLPDEDPELLSWVHRQALPGRDNVHVAVIQGLPLTTWKRPRGLHWSEYPVASDMAVKPDFPGWGQARVHFGVSGVPERVRPAHVIDAAVALRGADAVALLLTGSDFSALDENQENRILADCHRVLACAGVSPETPVLVVRIGRLPALATAGDLPSLCSDALAHDRFRFSYGVNASVIFGRLLADVLGSEPPSNEAPHDAECLPDDNYTFRQAVSCAKSGIISDLASPVGLQVLYRLRRFGAEGCPSLQKKSRYNPSSYPGPDLAALGGGPNPECRIGVPTTN